MTYHELIHTLIIHKNSIIKITILSTVFIFLILFFVYPKNYKADATILPPEQGTELGSLGGLITSQDFSSLVTGGLKNANSQLFAEMLKSRSAAEYVIEKHNLVEFYKVDNKAEAVKKLNENLEIEITKEGILKLSVNVKTSFFPIFDDNSEIRKISADLSNSFIEALDIINRDKLSSKAKRARVYIEEQLKKTKSELDSAESRLMEFQKVNKTISLSEQLSAAIDAAAKLKAEIAQTEIELGLLSPNLREDNKTLIALRTRLDELRSQYNKLELGNQDYLLAFREVPELGRELASLLREVKIQNEVYLLLQEQYYKEKIQENRDLPTIEVLDEAIPPVTASGPRIIVSSLAGGIFVFLLISLFFIAEEKKIFFYKVNKKEGEVV